MRTKGFEYILEKEDLNLTQHQVNPSVHGYGPTTELSIRPVSYVYRGRVTPGVKPSRELGEKESDVHEVT